MIMVTVLAYDDRSAISLYNDDVLMIMELVLSAMRVVLVLTVINTV
jgi:hypothetical protein